MNRSLRSARTWRQRRLMPTSWALCALCMVCLVAPQQVVAEFETPIALTNVRIVFGGGGAIDAGTIVITDGRFVAAGVDVEIPPHAERIDATGLIAYPGFINAQTHLGIEKDVRTEQQRARAEDENADPVQGPLPDTRRANRRGIRPELRAADLYNADDKLLMPYRKSGFTTALIAPRDGIFSGTSALIELSGLPVRRSVLRADVAMHGSTSNGEDGRYPRSLLGVVAQFRQTLLDAGYHAKLKKFAIRHPATGPRAPVDPALDALHPLLAGKQRYIFEANREREIRRAISLAEEFGLNLVITGAKEAWKVADLLKEKRIPLIVSLKFDKEPEYGKKKPKRPDKGPDKDDTDKPAPDSGEPEDEAHDETQPDAAQPDKSAESEKEKKKKDEDKIYEPLRLRKERRRLWEEQVHNVVRLHEAGIGFALRSSDLKKPGELIEKLRMVIERGLPEDAAVAALTTNAAAIVGRDLPIGRIAKGRLANLTVMDKPLSDKKAKVKYVFIDGKKFEPQRDKAEKGSGRGDRRRGPHAETPTTEEQTTDEPATEEEEDAPDEQETEAKTETPADADDKGPSFAVELKADRVPKTHTGGNVLIHNATIMPIVSPTLARTSILIRDGKITEIGQDIAVPDGVTVIEATGRFVIPGFIDAHSHLGLDAVNESPLSISAEVRIADVINPTSVGIYRALAGGTTTHHVMHGSANPIGGQNATLKLKYGRPAEEMFIRGAPPTIKFATGENVKQSNFPKNRGKRYPGSRMGVEAVYRFAMEAAKSYDAKREAHARQVEDGVDAPPFRRDLRLDALANVLNGDLTVHSHCYRSDEILRLMQVAEDYGFRIGVLQHVLEGYRIIPEIARHGAGASTFSNFWAYKVEAYGAIAHNAALMEQQGICTTVNSDSPNTIRYFGQEVAKSFRWGGLGEIDALKLVTINAARQLQIDDRVGSLQVGLDGDLAIFNGHPLNTFSKCVMTLIEGEVYFEDARPEPAEPCAEVFLPTTIDMAIPETVHKAFAITGGTVHTISGGVIENGIVVTVDDKIRAVGTDVEIPPGAGIIDATGKHVYPGLIDAGTALGLTEIGAVIATRDARDLATFGPNLLAASAFHPHSEHIAITRTAGTTTVLTAPSGGVISGQSAIMHLTGWTMAAMAIDTQFALHMRVPSLPARMGDNEERNKRRKDEFEKQSRKLEDFFAKAKHYAKVKALADSDSSISFDVDLTLEAMVPYIRREKPVVFSASGYKQILDTIDFATKHNVRCIINGATGAWKLADTLANRGIGVILSTPLSYPRGEYEPWDGIYRCAAALESAGATWCFASDSASGAYNLGTAAGMAVAHGLPADRAEYALTLGAAKLLGVDDRIGSIEVGKQADLIVTTGSPLQTTSVVTHMLIAGEPVELTSLHTRSYEKFKNRPKPDLPPPPNLRGPPSLTTR